MISPELETRYQHALNQCQTRLTGHPKLTMAEQLPEWEELLAIREWAAATNTRLHMDGARRWQCTPCYGCSMAEIAGLFDSVYVSFYKDMGGIAGSVLAGPDDFIDEAKTWIARAVQAHGRDQWERWIRDFYTSMPAQIRHDKSPAGN